MRINDFSEGIISEWVEALMLGMSALMRSELGRGGLKGRFVSRLRMRCAAVRWLRADITCVCVNAGLSGTCIDQYCSLFCVLRGAYQYST
jgi:hypothetical protein